MFAVVASARVSASFKIALVAAGYLLTQANVVAEHLASSCKSRPQLLTASLSTPNQLQFCLDTALRQPTSVKGNPASTPTATTTLPRPVTFDLNTSLAKSPDVAVDSDLDIPMEDRTFATRLRLTPEPSTLPHLLSWLQGWRMDIENGLFRPLRLRASRFAFAYTDIFDTRGNPDKGSHGLGFLFRYDFRKAPDRR
jgi:hypothetical protein